MSPGCCALSPALSSRRGSEWRPQCGLCELLSSGRPVPPPALPSLSPDNGRPLPGLPFIPPIGPLSLPAPTLGQSGGAEARRGIVRWPSGPVLELRLDNGQLWRCIAPSRSQSFLWGKLHEDQWWAGARPGRDHCQTEVVIYCSRSSGMRGIVKQK